MSESTTDQRTNLPGPAECPKTHLEERLENTGVNPKRCSPVEDGTKISRNHDISKKPTQLEGNYCVHGGGKLVVLDHDLPPEDRPGWVSGLPETFVIRTSHGGEHHYYVIPDESQLTNTKAHWGSIRYDGWYVVGPGSEVDHREYCDDDKEGCPGDGTGKYTIKSDRPIAQLTGDDVHRFSEDSTDEKPAEGSDKTPIAENRPLQDSAVGSSILDRDTRNLLDRAENFDKWGDQFVALKEGRYKDAGFPGDRSAAEYRLVEILGWLFDDDMETVRQVMTEISRLNPQTSAGTRKWLERPDEYRTLTLNAACPHESTYTPTTSSIIHRPEVSHVTSSKVYNAVLDLKIATTTEITEHPEVDRSQRQVQRAIKEYHDEGLLESVRDGRKVLYYLGKPFVPRDDRERYGI